MTNRTNADFQDVEEAAPVDEAVLQKTARDHMWLHFSRMGGYSADHPIPVIERGEGPYVFDTRGKRYLDGLSGLFVVQLGHGRRELAEAARHQAEKLAYFPLWSYAHPASIELADRLADYAPGDLNRVFFTTGGSEAVDTRKQYQQHRNRCFYYIRSFQVNKFHKTTIVMQQY